PKFFYGYIVVLVSTIIMMLSWGIFLSFGIFFEPLLLEFGETRAVTSAIYSVAILTNGLLSIITGRLNDKVGPRLIMTVCGALMGIGYLLMSQINVTWQIYLIYGGMIGTGMSGTFVPLTSTVARWFVRRRGMMTGIIFSGQGLGLVIMPLITSQLIYNYGWRDSYLMMGIISLVLIISAAQFLKCDPTQIGQIAYGKGRLKSESLPSQAKLFSLRQAVSTRQFWMLGAIIFSVLFSVSGVTIHIVIYAIGLGIAATTAANILPIIGAVSIFGRVTIGIASDRIGNKPSLVISFILMAFSLLLLNLAMDLRMLYLVSVIFGIGFGGLIVLTAPITAELFGLSSLGLILGVIMFVAAIGDAISPVMIGGIFDVSGSYHLAFLANAGAAILGIILSLLITPIRKENHTQAGQQ
ncbi:MFS transporter, partial [Chloroflexota bacterium]